MAFGSPGTFKPAFFGAPDGTRSRDEGSVRVGDMGCGDTEFPRETAASGVRAGAGVVLGTGVGGTGGWCSVDDDA